MMNIFKFVDGWNESVKQEEGMCWLFPYFTVIFSFGTVVARFQFHQHIERTLLPLVGAFATAVVLDMIALLLLPALYLMQLSVHVVDLGFFSSLILYEIPRMFGVRPFFFFFQVFAISFHKYQYSGLVRDLLMLQINFPGAADRIQVTLNYVHMLNYYYRKTAAVLFMFVALSFSRLQQY